MSFFHNHIEILDPKAVSSTFLVINEVSHSFYSIWTFVFDKGPFSLDDNDVFFLSSRANS